LRCMNCSGATCTAGTTFRITSLCRNLRTKGLPASRRGRRPRGTAGLQDCSPGSFSATMAGTRVRPGWTWPLPEVWRRGMGVPYHPSPYTRTCDAWSSWACLTPTTPTATPWLRMRLSWVRREKLTRPSVPGLNGIPRRSLRRESSGLHGTITRTLKTQLGMRCQLMEKHPHEFFHPAVFSSRGPVGSFSAGSPGLGRRPVFTPACNHPESLA
jgi:hypothetical protein